ncbi:MULTISPECIES: TetR-like C-terminal domain-containing protein [Brevibacterium]|uniref:TetR/AcrR family transcriptional regulator n=2 Tax=Brevibacterium TaxID=1696 RepID=A0A6G8KUG5_9MICO|nr:MULTISPECIES: TetR-like C-terminal domain-containing protein [Brevibacterium]MBD8020232.1 TetR/AcrR family transcriptional regulator [Brevibacterium gallinarum]QIN28150.1 TetR/AcrR family transcriptional regulator [Brevibacterium luteolum]
MTTNTRRRNNPAISQALFQAAERVMTTEGFSELTVDGLVNEVGTSRPAFYRRYRSIARLALDVILERYPDAPSSNTGSLRSDLLALQRNDVAMMTSPLLMHNLPALLEAMRTDEAIRRSYLDRFIAPRRRNVADVIAAAVGRGEIAEKDVDSEYICDLLFGPLLSRILLPTELPVTDVIARQTVATVLKELGVAKTGQA